MTNKTEEKDELDHSRQTWRDHEFTRKTLAIYKKDLTTATLNLREACLRSTDPDVRGMFERTRQLEVDVKYFEKAGVK